MKPKDITGQKFNRLTALYPTGEKSKWGSNYIWFCQCDCGNYTTADTGQLRSGKKKSCGCADIEHTKNLNRTHGGRFDRLYGVWMDMRRRCYDSKSKNYPLYGGRGIIVCDEWHDYSVFRDWAYQNGYDLNAKSYECTIDRIDVNGNYCPENCRWVNSQEQCNNKRNNVRLAFNGVEKTAAEWARELNIRKGLIYTRLKYGWTIEEILTIPPGKKKEYKKK